MSKKGEYKGECNRSACNELNAEYYNKSTKKFYCKSCATKINYWSEIDANTKLCLKIEEESLNDLHLADITLSNNLLGLEEFKLTDSFNSSRKERRLKTKDKYKKKKYGY